MGYYEKDKDNSEPYPGFDRATYTALGIGLTLAVLALLGLFGQIIG